MRCEKCGYDFAAGLPKCPRCGAAAHYGGKTDFYGKVVNSTLTVKDLFSEAFQKHSGNAGAKMFMAGTPLSTPAPERMLQEWEKPWLFTRILAVGLLFNLLSYLMYAQLGHPLGIYLLCTLGALVIPLGILTFFWEVNIPRDIPIYKVLLIFFIGGMLSLVFTLLLPSIDGPASLAPLTEEPGKVLALAIFVYSLNTKYIFGGLLVGAAVGAGFSAFENIHYVMTYGGIDLLIMRSLLTIGGHVTWAAIEGGALVMVKGSEPLQGKHFLDIRFLRYMGISMLLHFIWNSDFSIISLPLVADVKNVLLCAAAVYVAFTLIKKAISQVLAVADGANLGEAARSAGTAGSAAAAAFSEAVLVNVAGPLAGAEFLFRQQITIGRDPDICNVILPADTPGVSRCHCSLECRADGVYIMDQGSTAGTFLQTGLRLPPRQWVKLNGNFYLGSPSVLFAVNGKAERV